MNAFIGILVFVAYVAGLLTAALLIVAFGIYQVIKESFKNRTH